MADNLSRLQCSQSFLSSLPQLLLSSLSLMPPFHGRVRKRVVALGDNDEAGEYSPGPIRDYQ